MTPVSDSDVVNPVSDQPEDPPVFSGKLPHWFEEDCRDDAAVIWRYMSFAKLVSLFHTRSLYLSRADRLGDPFEGSAWLGARLQRTAIQAAVSRDTKKTVDIVAQLAEAAESARRRTAISCWHMADHESAAMWHLYSPSGQGIAVKSTIGRLRESLRACPIYLLLGPVRYLDYDRELAVEPTLNYIRPFFRKRISFQHEQELRLITVRLVDDDNVFDPRRATIGEGVLASTDLGVLLDEIRVAPNAPEWYRQAVVAVAERFGINCPVTQSALDAQAIF